MEATDLSIGVIEEPGSNGSVTTYLELTNNGAATLARKWRLYFSLGVTPTADETMVTQVLLDGRYGYLEPGPDWQDLAPASSCRINIENWLFSGMTLVARQGFHLAELNDSGEETLLGAPTLRPPELVALTAPRNPWVSARPPGPMRVPAGNANEIIPAVKQCQTSSDHIFYPGLYVTDNLLPGETKILEDLLDQYGIHTKTGAEINLSIDSSMDQYSYRLLTDERVIHIVGGNEAAIFYGIQTLRQLMRVDGASCILPKLQITDSPDFEHRGFFLDIARHFQSVEQIKKVIQAMAAYKMNRLQLGISNDEGWRLEIPSVPDLTRIGSRRSYHRFDEQGNPRALYPAWGDDHRDVEGYINANEYVALLKFANFYHVEIIPEFNLPGHANALLRSLDESPEWNLVDSSDTSSHRSAQGYSHNVVNVGLEDTYRLVKAVLQDIQSFYDAAGVRLAHIHFGGDEVPNGAWLHSPACRQLSVWNQDWNVEKYEDAETATQVLMSYHYNRITAIAEEVSPEIQIGFWHEMSPSGTDKSYYNAWITEKGNLDLVEDLLRRNHPLVISNASYLYLDMPYEMAADEPGLPWAGYINTETIYHFDPADSWKIPDHQHHLVLGIQAQLWTETVFTPELMDYYVFPRLLAVAERAWNRSPNRERWPDFVAALESRELGFLEQLGVNFRPFTGN